MILPTIYSIFMWQYNRNQYNKIISNVSRANAISKVANDDIPNELWNVVSGRKSVRISRHQTLLTILNDGILEIMKQDNNENRTLVVAYRIFKTLERNITLLEKQIENNSDVIENEALLDEIRSITNLFSEIIKDFIIEEIESAEITNNSIQNSSVFLLVMQALIICTGIFLSLTNLSVLSKKLRKSVSSMEIFSTELASGNLQAQMQALKITEFDHLVENLNTMAQQIDLLMKQNIEEQINLQKEEMSKLQSQITPHFLYNTFDTIIWLAEAGKTEQVIQMTTAFSKFLRISLSRGHDWITISQEIQHVENYLTIQKMRYEEILNYEIEVDEQLNNFVILKSTLQPLVENAIYHGIKNKRGRGHIKVTAEFSDESKQFMTISVIDDGAGFTQERLEQVREEINQKSGENLASVYGLYNVNKRLILYYNEKKCGLNIESERMKGAKIYFTIPCLVEKKED